MNQPGRLPDGNARSRFLSELPSRTDALTALAFQFAENRGEPAKRKELQAGLEALLSAAQEVGEVNIVDHAETALACLEVCEQSQDEAPAHIIAELQMLVSALPWLALADSRPASSRPASEAPIPPEAVVPPAVTGDGGPVKRSGARRRADVDLDLALDLEAELEVQEGQAARTTAEPGSAGSSTTAEPGSAGSMPGGVVPATPAPSEVAQPPSASGAGGRQKATTPVGQHAQGGVPGGSPAAPTRGAGVSPGLDAEPLDPGRTLPGGAFSPGGTGHGAEFELTEGPVVLPPSVSNIVSPTQPVPVMVVDHSDRVAAVRAALPRERYTITGAADGEEALALLSSVAPAVVLVRADLASDEELALVARLRRDPVGAVSFVLLMGEPMSPERVADLDCDGWVATPIDPQLLGAQLGRLTGVDDSNSRLRTLTEGTVYDIVEGVAEEIRRGLVDSLRVGEHERIVLEDRDELLAAAWSTIGRVRSHLTERTGGRVRFESKDVATQEPPVPVVSDAEGQGMAALAGRKVLVADDDPAVLWTFSGLLREASATVLEASDGQEALQLCRAHRPHLIVSDILMPKLDGFALCRELKRDVVLWDIPVILLSWKEDYLSGMRELQPGAIAYLRKESDRSLIISTLAEALSPRVRLEGLLATPTEIHGRVEQVGVLSVLELVATHRPDARLSVRDPFNLYEVDLRAGQHLSVSRTATDGSFARGPGVLQQLLGVRTGRFSVEPAQGPLRGGVLPTLLPAALQEAARRVSAVLDAVSGDFIMRIGKVVFDNRMLLALSEVSPPPLTEFVRNVLKEDTPLRERLQTGALAKEEVEPQLRELARLGAISEVIDVHGADLIEEAYTKLVGDPGRLVHALGSTVPAVGHSSAPPVAKRTLPLNRPDVDTAAPRGAAGPNGQATTAPVAEPLAKESRALAHPAVDAFAGDAEVGRTGGDLFTRDESLDTREGLPLAEFPVGDEAVRLVTPDLEADAAGTRDEVVALAATLDSGRPPSMLEARRPPAPPTMVPGRRTGLPPFLTSTERRRAEAGSKERDPLDATAGFALLDAEPDAGLDVGLADTAHRRSPTFVPAPVVQQGAVQAVEGQNEGVSPADGAQVAVPSRKVAQAGDQGGAAAVVDAPTQRSQSDTPRVQSRRQVEIAETAPATPTPVPSSAVDDDGDGLEAVLPTEAQAVQKQPSLDGVPAEQPSLDGVPAEQPSLDGVPAEQPSVDGVPAEQPSVEDMAVQADIPADADLAGDPERSRPTPTPPPLPSQRLKTSARSPLMVSLQARLRALSLLLLLALVGYVSVWAYQTGVFAPLLGPARFEEGRTADGTAQSGMGEADSTLVSADHSAADPQLERQVAPGGSAPLGGGAPVVGQAQGAVEEGAGPEEATEVDEADEVALDEEPRLDFIDPQYGVPVAEDEGLLVIRCRTEESPPVVRVGSQDLGPAPTAVALPEGRHEVAFRKGAGTRFRYVVMRRGQTQILVAP